MGNFIDSHITGRKKFVSDDNNPNLVTVPYDTSLDLSNNFTINIMLNTLSINSFIAEQENSWKLETVNGALRLTLYDSGLNTLIFTSDSAIVNSSIDKLYSLVWDNTAKTFTAYTNAVLEGYTQTGTGTIGTFVVNNPANPITIFQKTGENTFLGEFIYFGIESEAYTSVQIGTLYSEIENVGQVPDSQDIVFISSESGTNQVHRMTINGQDRDQLTSSGDNNYPLWNYTTNEIMMERNGSQTVKITENGGSPTVIGVNTVKPCWLTETGNEPNIRTDFYVAFENVLYNRYWTYSFGGVIDEAMTLGATWFFSPDPEVPHSVTAGSDSQLLRVRISGSTRIFEKVRLVNVNSGDSSAGTYYSTTNPVNRPKFNTSRTHMGWSELIGGVWHVFIMDMGTMAVSQITSGLDNYEFNAISPDGTKVLAHSDKTGNNQLYLMDINGANIKNISNNSFEEYNGDWK